MSELRYPSLAFDEQELINAMNAVGRNYIVQGQRVVALGNRLTKTSFDVWLRKRFSKNGIPSFLTIM